MEVNRRREDNRGMEENTLAILDTSGFNRKETQITQETQDLNDDRLAFLEAVRSASIVPVNGTAPTHKMFEAIFQILTEESSLDSIMSSYLLLNELETRFPRVYVSDMKKAESSSPLPSLLELVVVEEAWSPFIFGLDGSFSEKAAAHKKSGGSLDSSGFHILIQDLIKFDDESRSEASQSELLRKMLLFQYLVYVLEGDFLPRNRVYKEHMKWTLLRESLLNMFLGSRRIVFKALIKDCISIMCKMCHVHPGSTDDLSYPENSSTEKLENCNSAIAIAFPEVEKCTCTALQKLLLMIMELDISKEKAETQGLTTRADGVRTPVAEIILDELTYNRDILSPFFQVFDEPRWKLEMIVQYFRKYIAKPSVRTRRSNGSTDDATFGGVLRCFSNGNSTKSITKKISNEVAQLLLAHAFQAYLSLSSEYSIEGTSDSKEDVGASSLVEICKNLITAFTSIKRANERAEILPFGKEALFTAATILSAKS